MLVPKSDLTSEISAKSVLSKLVLLVLHYPAMRILWARDSRATANLFIALKQKQQQPSIEQAVTAMSHAVKNQQAGYEFGQSWRVKQTKCTLRQAELVNSLLVSPPPAVLFFFR